MIHDNQYIITLINPHNSNIMQSCRCFETVVIRVKRQLTILIRLPMGLEIRISFNYFDVTEVQLKEHK